MKCVDLIDRAVRKLSKMKALAVTCDLAQVVAVDINGKDMARGSA